jgi:UDP:flavonoid glycosyltransferase YjiC (YdhE family)
MKVVILTAGSHGDTRPYVALGLGLKKFGLEVRIATFEEHRKFVQRFNIDFSPLKGTPFSERKTKRINSLAKTGSGPQRFVERFHSDFSQSLDTFLVDCWHAALDADVILCANLGFAGYHIAEKLNIPCFSLPLQPVYRTKYYPAMSLPEPRYFRKYYNYLTHLYAEQLFWQPMRMTVNQWRRNTLGLTDAPFFGPFQSLNKANHKVLCGFSNVVFQKPVDWNDNIHVTGYWFLPDTENWEPGDEIADFVQNNSRPIYIGFGSLPISDSHNIQKIILEYQRRVGKPLIVGGALGELFDSSPSSKICTVGYVPHQWLFSKVDLAIHHGGAGTVASALRAGIPSIIVPFFGDQFFWGKVVEEKELGRQISLQDLNAGELANLTEQLLSQALSFAITRTKRKLNEEDGVKECVRVILDSLG